MKKEQYFDIIVIGAGSGGLNIASFMNNAGFKVLLIDKNNDAIGGDCLNFGCVPSKALIHIAQEVHSAKNAEAFGFTVGGQTDWKKVRTYIQEKQTIIREHENAEWFTAKGISVALGSASFVSKDTVSVNSVEYSAKKIVLATGSRPRVIEGQGIEHVRTVLNNENIFSMEILPKKLLMVGAGPIGIEIAQALTYLGTKVTVIDPGTQILGKEDTDMSDVLMRQMEDEGVVFLLKHTLKTFTDSNEAVCIDDDGKQITVSFDAVFVGIGRVLNTEGLQLEKAGVELDSNGKLKVDEYLRTTNKNVLVCGDIAGNFQFTHAAEMHASVILKNFFSPLKTKFIADSISWVTYTNPQIATFGIGERELHKRAQKYRVLETDFKHDDRAITDNYQYGKAKLFISPTGTIFGGTMVAPHAGELIQELVLAQTLKLPAKKLFYKTYAYPVATRINKRLIALFMSEKLTPVTKFFLRVLY